MAKADSVPDILAGLNRIERKMRPLTRARDKLTSQLERVVKSQFDAALAKVNDDPAIPYLFRRKSFEVGEEDGRTCIVLTSLVDKATGKALGPESLGNEPWGERLDLLFRESLGFPKHVVGEMDPFSVRIDSYYFEEP